MISPKLAAMMAAMTLIGAGAPITALADHGNNFEVDIERNNAIEQEQEACTNEVEVEAGEDQIALVNADQNNECEVDQNQEAVIVDFSENAFDIAGLLVS